MPDSLDWIGVDVASPAPSQRQAGARADAAEAGEPAWDWAGDLPAARPVLGGPGGGQFYSWATPRGPVLLPYIAGTAFDPADPALAGGGYIPQGDLNARAGSGHAPDAAALAGRLAAGTAHGAPPAAPTASLLEEPPGAEAGGSDDAKINNPLSPFAQTLASNTAAYLLSGDKAWDAVRNGLAGAGSAVAGQLVSQLTGRLLAMWELDDSSSTGEFVAKQAAEQVAGKMQAELQGQVSSYFFNTKSPDGLTKRLDEFFNGATSTATLPAATVGTKDDKANTALVVPLDAPVHADDKPAAKAFADTVVPAGRLILDGSMTVLVNGKMFSRLGSVTAVQSRLESNVVASVLVGGSSPVPAATKAALDKLNSTGGDTTAAEKESQRVAGPAEAARQQALKDGKTEAEADAAANRRGAQEAGKHQFSKEAMDQLVEHTYKDGERGLLDDEDKPAPAAAKVGEKVQTADGVTMELVELRDAATDPSLPAGYRVGVYKNPETGQAVVVYMGSAGFPSVNPFSSDFYHDVSNRYGDWFANNLPQGLGLIPSQYGQAGRDLAEFQSNPDYFVGDVTGHSLGGGLATYAGLMHGVPVTAFNPAGLGSGSVLSVSQSGIPRWPGQVQNHLVQGEVLSDVSTRYIGQPAVFGDVHEYPNQPYRPAGPPDAAGFVPTVPAGMVANHNLQTEAMAQGEVRFTPNVPMPNPPVLFPDY